MTIQEWLDYSYKPYISKRFFQEYPNIDPNLNLIEDTDLIQKNYLEPFKRRFCEDLCYFTNEKGKSYAIGHFYFPRLSKRGFEVKRIYLKTDKARKKRKVSRNVFTMYKNLSNLRNPCQIEAYAEILGLSLSDSHKDLKSTGWSEDDTWDIYNRWEKSLRKRGYSMKIVYCHREQKRNNLHGISVKNSLNIIDPNKRYLITTNSHALCAINGEIFDSHDNSNRIVEKIVEIKKYE